MHNRWENGDRKKYAHLSRNVKVIELLKKEYQILKLWAKLELQINWL